MGIVPLKYQILMNSPKKGEKPPHVAGYNMYVFPADFHYAHTYFCSAL